MTAEVGRASRRFCGAAHTASSLHRQHAEALFVLADRLSDQRLQLACSQQMMAVRADANAWWQLVVGAGLMAVSVLALAANKA